MSKENESDKDALEKFIDSLIEAGVSTSKAGDDSVPDDQLSEIDKKIRLALKAKNIMDKHAALTSKYRDAAMLMLFHLSQMYREIDREMSGLGMQGSALLLAAEFHGAMLEAMSASGSDDAIRACEKQLDCLKKMKEKVDGLSECAESMFGNLSKPISKDDLPDNLCTGE